MTSTSKELAIEIAEYATEIVDGLTQQIEIIHGDNAGTKHQAAADEIVNLLQKGSTSMSRLSDRLSDVANWAMMQWRMTQTPESALGEAGRSGPLAWQEAANERYQTQVRNEYNLEHLVRARDKLKAISKLRRTSPY